MVTTAVPIRNGVTFAFGSAQRAYDSLREFPFDFVKERFRQKPEVGLAQSNGIAELEPQDRRIGPELDVPLSSRKTTSFNRIELHRTRTSFSALPSLPSIVLMSEIRVQH